jgi:succinate dehydrogenase / fumarate reductase cytochrome b subunit
MAKTLPLTHSYIGKKALMAASGLVLLGFVIVHMLANLQMFAGAARIDGYARSLREVPVVLWGARAVLVLAFLAHSMLWTGVVLALFVLVHLANLTWGAWHPRFVAGDVYGNVVRLFRGAPAAVFYALAMVALGLHVAHGGFSLWQSLGLNGPATSPVLRRGARILAVVVAGGLLSVVAAAALGWLR